MKKVVTALLVFIVFILGISLIKMLAGDSSSQAAKPQTEQTELVTAQLYGGVQGDPFLFGKMCGEPDHVRNTTIGALVWVYEQQRVLVTFMRHKKTDHVWRIAYNVYDPQRYAQWGETGFLQPRDALSRIGCKIPANFEQVLASEKSGQDAAVFNSAFDALRSLRSTNGASFRLKSPQMTADESVCYRFMGKETGVDRAVLTEGELTRQKDKRFGENWGRECEGKIGHEEASDLLKVLTAWDHAE